MDLTTTATERIAAAREVVFDFVTAPEAVGKTFTGYGPIPGAERSEVVTEGGMRVGAIRHVHNRDGSVIEEEIVALERPARQAYRLVRGFRPPASWLVRGARGDWQLDADGDGTHITWTFTFELRSALAWPFAALMRRSFRKAMQVCLANTRRMIEQG